MVVCAGMIGKAIESRGQQQQEQKRGGEDAGHAGEGDDGIRDVKTTSVPDSMFEIPAGYREVKVETAKPTK